MAIATVNRLVRNASVAAGSHALADTWAGNRALNGGTTLLSTGAAPNNLVTVPYDVDDKIAFRVSWVATAASTGVLTVTHGSERRGWQKDIGSFDLSMTAAGATGKVFYVGPFETARFAIKSTSTDHAPVGRNYVKFTGSTGAASEQGRRWNIQAFRMPDVRYST